MKEFKSVIELLAKGDVERAASEFASAVYDRQNLEITEEKKREEENES